MSVRSLMKAKAASNRLNHPYAKYDFSNKLSCSLCNSLVKGGDQLWGAHLQSKSHRVNVAHLEKEKELQRQNEQEEESRRRARIEEGKKRRLVDVIQEESQGESEEDVQRRDPKRQKMDVKMDVDMNGLPNDFFDNPQARIAVDAADDVAQANQVIGNEKDEEWEAFEAEILGSKGLPVVYSTTSTIVGNAVMYDSQVEQTQQQEEEDDEVVETEEEKRERLAREEKEEAMSRILEEEREQLEGDRRVESMRKLVEMRRKQRKKKTITT